MSVIEVEDLVKSYHRIPVVNGISFTVEEGEIFAILGPSGAGKTTTVESISGLRQPDSGKIRVLGLDPLQDVTELRERVGVQLQESQLPDRIEVGEAMDLYASFYGAPTDWRNLLELLGLGDKRDTRYAKLSGGQKQRISVALALVAARLLDQVRQPARETVSQRELECCNWWLRARPTGKWPSSSSSAMPR
jgi:ABC-2 type transport system ATP-binding protein